MRPLLEIVEEIEKTIKALGYHQERTSWERTRLNVLREELRKLGDATRSLEERFWPSQKEGD